MRRDWLAVIAVILAASWALAFIVIDDTHDQTVNGVKVLSTPVIGGVTFTELSALTPVEGQMQTCTNCTAGSDPCSGSGSGAQAYYVNSRWVCGSVGGLATSIDFGGATTVLHGTGGIAYSAGGTVNDFVISPNVLPKGGGANSPLSDSSLSDNGTTVSTTENVSLYQLSYGKALYITGTTAISSDTPAVSTDRVILCTGGSGSNITYTLPAATGSGRVIDVVKVDSGSASCVVGVPSGAINGGTTRTLPTQWNADTCWDEGSGQWLCRGDGATA